MTGGAGNDVYDVDSFADIVTELAGGGTDLVRTTVWRPRPRAPMSRISNSSGSADISGIGNELANFMTGNGGKNMLIGKRRQRHARRRRAMSTL